MNTIQFEDGTEYGPKDFVVSCAIGAALVCVGAAIYTGVGAIRDFRINRKMAKSFEKFED